MRRAIPAAALAAVLLTVGPSRMESMDDKEKSTAGRFESWQEGLEMLRGNPLTGVGSGQWQQHHHLLAHNTFVQTMGESGMIGLFSFVGIFYTILRPLSAFACRLRDRLEKSTAVAVFCGFVAFLTASFFLTTTQFDLVYIFAGLTAALCDLKGLTPKLTLSNYKRIGAISVATVFLIYGSVRLYF
jgi:O-antigen ligase